MNYTRHGKTVRTDVVLAFDRTAFFVRLGHLSVAWFRNTLTLAERDALAGRCIECRAWTPDHAHGCSQHKDVWPA